MNPAVFFLSPFWFLAASIILFLISRKTIRAVFGTFDLSTTLWNGLSVFVQLLVMSLALDYFSTLLGINDLHAVDAVAQTISSQGGLGVISLGVSALIEEIFFRGILFSLVSPMASTVLFGLAHAGYGSLIELAGALLAGFILMRARRETDSIFPGFAGHFLYNLVAVFVLL